METKQVIEDKVIKKIEELRKEKNPNFTSIPDFRPGDTINVAVRVVEGEKERIQNFKGIVLSRRGSGINQTFTVRKISNYIGVERIFPLYSPIIQNIELVSKGNVRRSKIYFIRGLNEKKIRQKLR
ncbi:MAG TPA: 50S ribosomal protein L19 [Candidatus Kapabacteria bacterium]|jgi:large subunit ribosomal protein L19|nr:50S ribosomal protein L19 [Candidatus Kapabacteria bacterium]HOV92910.1 50S ribosomal protein L19 [Candidatus Kapabacteria bacterium]